MFTESVNLTSLDDAKEFVNLTSKYSDVSMHLRVDNYEIDAHSIVGVLTIVDSDQSAVFTANLPENDERLLNDITPFLAKAVG